MTTTDKKLLVSDVMARIKRSRNTLYYHMKTGKLPRPKKEKLSGRVYWYASELNPVFKALGV